MSLHFQRSGVLVGELDEVVVKLNLLAHAQMLELETGSRCGGHGVCGGDRVRLSLDVQKRLFSAPTHVERSHLSASELGEGWRLACQCFPNFDLQDEEIVVELLPVRS